MLLRHLLSALPNAELPPDMAAAEATGVEENSARVRRGTVFVAIPGFTVDGHRFVDDAQSRGAVAVVVERGRGHRPPGWDDAACAWIEVPDTRVALSALAAAWNERPARQMRVIGVTGTDGKTTTTCMTAAVLAPLGETGLISTARIKIAKTWQDNPTRQTSLEPLDVQATLARMRAAGVASAVVEASSHGLALHKLDDCAFDLAVVTNMSEDHLDFHQTRAAYWAAKARLLELVAAGSGKAGPHVAVLNADDISFDYLRQRATLPLVSFSLEQQADLKGTVTEARADGSRVRVSGRWGEGVLWVPMAGRFNVANALAASAVALAYEIPLAAISHALSEFGGVPGRMMAVDERQPFTVLVDYAHTGHALTKLLTELRPLTRGRLILVFGSAGEQSRERRTGLAAAAAQFADFCVLTSEDPRHEDPDAIIADIAAALVARGKRETADFVRVTDRREAIGHAVAIARPGDLVLLTGKGHEQSIIVGDTRIPWDEAAAVREALRGKGAH